jgi:hypothetical protein
VIKTVWQTDTARTAINSDSTVSVKKAPRQPTPAEVLKWLPRDATPSQQDSAIQANIKPGVIHWSEMPDTLHLPGQPAGKSFRDVSLPQYYKESFFSKDSLFHPELTGGRLGVAGDPIPYTIANDNLITGLLLLCFILTTIVISRSKRFIARQAKYFFYHQISEDTLMTETTGEVHFQLFLVLQTCFLLSIVFFFWTNSPVSGTFIVEQYTVIGLFAAILAGYFIVKVLAYSLVDNVFFSSKSNIRWLMSFFFLISMEGVAIYPVVLLLSFFHLSIDTVFIYTIIIVFIFKFLSFYKTYSIFFKRAGGYMQNFLYFCALEIMPLFALWGILQMASNNLKVIL